MRKIRHLLRRLIVLRPSLTPTFRHSSEHVAVQRTQEISTHLPSTNKSKLSSKIYSAPTSTKKTQTMIILLIILQISSIRRVARKLQGAHSRVPGGSFLRNSKWTLSWAQNFYKNFSDGIDLQTYVIQFFRERNPQMKPSPVPRYPEMEAFNLARMLQVTLLTVPCHIAGVETTPWMEIALRRLHVILQIEDAVFNSPLIIREVAWET